MNVTYAIPDLLYPNCSIEFVMLCLPMNHKKASKYKIDPFVNGLPNCTGCLKLNIRYWFQKICNYCVDRNLLSVY